jgi:hypothetical protein
VNECAWHGHSSLKVAAKRMHAERLGAVMEQDGENPRAHLLRLS